MLHHHHDEAVFGQMQRKPVFEKLKWIVVFTSVDEVSDNSASDTYLLSTKLTHYDNIADKLTKNCYTVKCRVILYSSWQQPH